MGVLSLSSPNGRSSMEMRGMGSGDFDRDGIRMRKAMSFLKSGCCYLIYNESALIPISESSTIDIMFLVLLEAHFTQSSDSVNGFWAARREFVVRMGGNPDNLISLSSLKRGWTEYLSLLSVPPSSFLCCECGRYP
ncbi:hypothetical protein PFISCL1PPCAC_15546, partial [Pristionchus fissidentatus]